MTQERLKILLIEHDAGFTRTLGEMLGQARELAALVSSAEDLRTGVSVLNGDHFDLVMLDVAVPDGAGLGNISLLRAEAPRLPIIAAGDADDETVAVEAVQAGAQDYLVKSRITPGWLERSIRYAIERHRMDMTLLAAEARYHAIFDHLVEGIFQTTPQGSYLLANTALARIYGYSSPEELKRSVTDIGQRLYVREDRRQEFVRLMQERDIITEFESEIYRKDGSRIWISENCRAVRDTAGTLLYYEGTVEDITQRRQAQEALRYSESLYHSLVETMPQNVFRKDLQGRFTFANQQFCRHFSSALSEVLGKTDFDFFPKALAEQYLKDDQRIVETGRTHAIVEDHQPLGQKRSVVQVVKTPLYANDGTVIGLQGIFWDITEQRLAEERLRRTNALLERSREELRAKNTEMEDDLKMAREIQLTMLPQQFPVFPHHVPPAESAFHFTHRYLPTSAVGGDFFTVSALSDFEACVFICDVAGHGVRSALVTAMIRALLEELKHLAGDPGRFLTKLNHDLHAIFKHAGTPMLTTAFYLVADWRTGTLRYTNAGHPKPFHIRRGENQVAPLQNIGGKAQAPLGLLADTAYQTSECRLASGDLIMMFTDGLYEVHNVHHDIYSQTELIQNVERHLHLSVPQLFDELIGEIQGFSAEGRFGDDVCLVSMEVGNAARG